MLYVYVGDYQTIMKLDRLAPQARSSCCSISCPWILNFFRCFCDCQGIWRNNCSVGPYLRPLAIPWKKVPGFAAYCCVLVPQIILYQIFNFSEYCINDSLLQEKCLVICRFLQFMVGCLAYYYRRLTHWLASSREAVSPTKQDLIFILDIVQL